MSITLTDNAAMRVRQFIDRDGGKALRLAVEKTGCSGWAYVVTLATEIGADDHLFEDKGVQVVVVDEALYDAQGGPQATFTSLEKRSPEREFVCLTTSGSSGDPRIVARTSRAVCANVKQVSSELRVSSEDRFLSVVPFWHANGFSNCLLMPLYCGASIITMGRFLPRAMLDLILELKPTVVIGSPFVFRSLAQVVDPQCDLSHVRTWI